MTEQENDLERRKKIIQGMNIMDDDFFVKVAEDIRAMEEMLRVLLQDASLRLKWTKSQVSLRNCGNRSVVVDSLCKAWGGKLYLSCQSRCEGKRKGCGQWSPRNLCECTD